MPGPLPDLKLRVATNLPASITYGVGVSVEKQNGVYNFLLDYSDIGQEAAISPADYQNNWQLFWNAATNKFTLIPYTLPTAKVTGASTTSADVSTGTKNFTVEQNIGWAAGMRLRGTDVDNRENYIEGTIVSYDPATGALAINVDRAIGSGTIANWSFGVVGDKGLGDVAAANNLSEFTATAAAARTNLGIDAATVGLVDTVANLAAWSTAGFQSIVLTAPGKTGIWLKKAYADFTADVAADTTNGYVVRSTSDTSYVWVREEYYKGLFLVDWWRTAGATAAQEKAAIEAAGAAIPSNSTLAFPWLAGITSDPVAISTRGHIKIKGNGATINCTSQTPTTSGANVPLFRVFVGTQNYDLDIDDLHLVGPRLTTDIVAGTGAYGGTPTSPGPGMPSGYDIPIGRNVTIRNCGSTGTYFAALEAHYVKCLIVQRFNANNHGYAGVMWTDCDFAAISYSVVDDIGSVAPNDGYGISAATSYNFPGYAYGNKVAFVHHNNVTRCKRKALDVHNVLNAVFSENYVKGCGSAYFEGICEGDDKQVARIILKDNIFEGDPAFLSGAVTNAIISMGQSGPTVAASQDTMMVAAGNIIKGIIAPNGIVFTSNQAAGTSGLISKVTDNAIAGCTFSGPAITTANYAQLFKMVSVRGNDIQATVGTAHIYIQNAVDALSTGNICRNAGTPPTSVTTLFSGVTNGNANNNMLDGVLGK